MTSSDLTASDAGESDGGTVPTSPSTATDEGHPGSESDGTSDPAEVDAGATPITSGTVANILFSVGELNPAFSQEQAHYRVDVPLWVESVFIELVTTEGEVTVFVDNETFEDTAVPRELTVGQNTFVVRSETDGAETGSYTVDVYRASAVVEDLYGKAQVPNEAAQFGLAVGVSGDRIAVGAPGDGAIAKGIGGDESELGAPVSGAAYVLARTSIGWEQEAFIKAENAESEDRFGYSLAFSGTTLVVGAPAEGGGSPGVNGPDNNDLPSSGAAYVFERAPGGWQQVAYLKAEVPEIGDGFGQSVATDGQRIVVGAYAESNSLAGVNPSSRDVAAPYSGAAYVFERDGSAWAQVAYLKASNPDPGDQFGESVSVEGDTVVVGAPGEQSNASGVNGDEASDELFVAGAAYVFAVDVQGRWSQSAYLKPSNTKAEMRFGNAVSVDAETIAVGAFTEASSGAGIGSAGDDADKEEAGAVYVFERRSEEWSESAFIKASNADAGDRFGQSVIARGDTLVVGAPLESSADRGANAPQNDNSALGAGAAYIFFRNSGAGGSEWAQQVYLKASNAEPGDNFGLGIGFDGVSLVVGAPYEDNAKGGLLMEPSPNNALRETGAVYLFR